MDFLFENEYKRDVSMARQVYFYYFFKRPFYVVADIALAVSFIVNCILALSGGKYAVLLFAAAPFCYLGQYLMYRETVKMLVRRDKSNYGDEPPTVKTVIDEKKLTYTVASNEPEKIELDSVSKIVTTKDYILIILKGGVIYTLKKDSFTKGTPESLIQFLKTKNFKNE